MKTKWIIIVTIIVFSIGCTRVVEDQPVLFDGEITLHASFEGGQTKTVLQQNGRVWWKPSDCIKVFYGEAIGKFTSTNEEPDSSAEFKGTLGSFVLDEEKEFKAVYPYSETTAMSGNTISINLPSEQAAEEGTFADGLLICVAKSKDFNLYFKNVCGGVKFSLERRDIRKVVFRGNDGETIAGLLNVVFDDDGMPQVADITDGSTSVTLVAPDEGTFKQGVWYYLVLAPQVLTKGYTMELWTDSLAETISSDASVTVRRSAWGVLKGLGTPNGSMEAVDLGLPSGLKWASCNIGASTPEEHGDYFAWGETEPYYSSQDPLTWKEGKEAGYNCASYKWCNGDEYSMTKYCTDDWSGPVDNKTVLDPEDDAASVNWGGKWRMPTDEEWGELIDECTWIWTTQYGKSGYLVTSTTNGNSIFLPAAGLRYDTYLIDAESDYEPGSGYYWSSSLNTYEEYYALYVSFYEYGVYREDYNSRCNGFSVRPVTVSVKSVSLNKISLTLNVGNTAALTATVSPSNATQQAVIWQSSDTSVATVDYAGVVTAVAVGTATITVTTYDGGLKAACSVTVNPPDLTPTGMMHGYGYVDLGLPSGLKWASCNVGASAPEGYGEYYAWGETEPYYEDGYSQSDDPVWRDGKSAGYNLGSYKFYTSSGSYTKYVTDPEFGVVDNKTALDSEDDAAYANWGDSWRIPTIDEWEELLSNCTQTWTTHNGVRGMLLTGSNGNNIFLPAAGLWDIKPDDTGSCGDYWSSSLMTDDPWGAWGVDFTSNGAFKCQYCRYYGQSVRPVLEKSVHAGGNERITPGDDINM